MKSDAPVEPSHGEEPQDKLGELKKGIDRLLNGATLFDKSPHIKRKNAEEVLRLVHAYKDHLLRLDRPLDAGISAAVADYCLVAGSSPVARPPSTPVFQLTEAAAESSEEEEDSFVLLCYEAMRGLGAEDYIGVTLGGSFTYGYAFPVALTLAAFRRGRHELAREWANRLLHDKGRSPSPENPDPYGAAVLVLLKLEQDEDQDGARKLCQRVLTEWKRQKKEDPARIFRAVLRREGHRASDSGKLSRIDVEPEVEESGRDHIVINTSSDVAKYQGKGTKIHQHAVALLKALMEGGDFTPYDDIDLKPDDRRHEAIRNLNKVFKKLGLGRFKDYFETILSAGYKRVKPLPPIRWVD